MGTDREKEIKYLLYLKEQLIRNTKKESKKLRQELQTIKGEKRLRKEKGYYEK